jgi:hypothetical protein
MPSSMPSANFLVFSGATSKPGWLLTASGPAWAAAPALAGNIGP